MKSYTSPNHDARAPGTAIDILLIHYTGMPTTTEALERLCDPASKVSAHYLIDESGRVFPLVDNSRRAWHAGDGTWHGQGDINSRSIGIELANPGHDWGYRSFPANQITALIALATGLCMRYGIARERVLGHSDIAPRRKQDPGEKFPWEELARAGLGLWADFSDNASYADPLPPAEKIKAETSRLLARIGYGAQYPLEAVVTAFQRHFVPHHVTGHVDAETWRRLSRVAQTVKIQHP